jgi:phosphate/sulfate permease
MPPNFGKIISRLAAILFGLSFNALGFSGFVVTLHSVYHNRPVNLWLLGVWGLCLLVGCWIIAPVLTKMIAKSVVDFIATIPFLPTISFGKGKKTDTSENATKP